MRQLSASGRNVDKWLPLAAAGGFAALLISTLFSEIPWQDGQGHAVPAWQPVLFGLAVLTISMLVPWWLLSRDLRSVSTDGQQLFVSDRLDEIAIPLARICRVWDSGFGVERVSVEFREDTPVGRRIRFAPPRRWPSGWTEPPVVEELLALVQANGGHASREPAA